MVLSGKAIFCPTHSRGGKVAATAGFPVSSIPLFEKDSFAPPVWKWGWCNGEGRRKKERPDQQGPHRPALFILSPSCC